MATSDELAKLYAKAMQDMITRFEKLLRSGKSGIDYQKAMMLNLKKTFNAVLQTRKDLRAELKADYLNQKVDELVKASAYIKVDEKLYEYTKQDQKHIDTLYRVFNDKMNKAEQNIGRQFRDFFTKEQEDDASTLNKLVRNIYTERTMGGLTKKDAVEELIRGLQQNLFVNLVDKHNKPLKMSMAAYAKLNVNSMFQQGRNTAAIETGKKLDNHYVRFSRHYWTCATCAKYAEGRVYSTDKKDTKYQYLYDIVPGFRDGYNLIHPNCKHLLSGFYEEAYSKKELKGIESYSHDMRDLRSKEMIAKYDAAQDKNRRKREREAAKRKKFADSKTQDILDLEAEARASRKIK